MKIKHIFFDLDRTLWDFDANSRLELEHLWMDNKLYQRGITLPDQFIKVYEKINSKCWAQYQTSQITKTELRSKRFIDTLSYFGISDNLLGEKMGLAYIENSPKRTVLVNGAIELLTYLKEKYTLHIITNGFKEVQFIKLNNCGLSPFFKEIITSEEVGELKPHYRVFEYSLEKAKAIKEESIYIGDDYKADVEGAFNFGMPVIYYNPKKEQHQLSIFGEVSELNKIKNIL